MVRSYMIVSLLALSSALHAASSSFAPASAAPENEISSGELSTFDYYNEAYATILGEQRYYALFTCLMRVSKAATALSFSESERSPVAVVGIVEGPDQTITGDVKKHIIEWVNTNFLWLINDTLPTDISDVNSTCLDYARRKAVDHEI